MELEGGAIRGWRTPADYTVRGYPIHIDAHIKGECCSRVYTACTNANAHTGPRGHTRKPNGGSPRGQGREPFAGDHNQAVHASRIWSLACFDPRGGTTRHVRPRVAPRETESNNARALTHRCSLLRCTCATVAFKEFVIYHRCNFLYRSLLCADKCDGSTRRASICEPIWSRINKIIRFSTWFVPHFISFVSQKVQSG